MTNQLRIFGECTYKGNRFNEQIDRLQRQLQIRQKKVDRMQDGDDLKEMWR